MACGHNDDQNNEKGNCATAEKKCCAVKFLCKLFCFLFMAVVIYVQCLILREVKQLNQSVDFVAEYLDEIRANAVEIKDSSNTLKGQMNELKNENEESQ